MSLTIRGTTIVSGHHDTQHNDTKYNDSQHNDSHHKGLVRYTPQSNILPLY